MCSRVMRGGALGMARGGPQGVLAHAEVKKAARELFRGGSHCDYIIYVGKK